MKGEYPKRIRVRRVASKAASRQKEIELRQDLNKKDHRASGLIRTLMEKQLNAVKESDESETSGSLVAVKLGVIR